MKTFALKAAVCAAVLITAAGPALAEFRDRTFRVSNGINADHPVNEGMKAMQTCLDEKTGGKMQMQGFWGGALGGDLQATQAVRSGLQEAVVTSSSPLVGMLPALGVFDLPFLFRSPEEAYQVMDGPFGDMLTERMDAIGLVNLGYWENGFRNMSNSQRPIQTWEDFEGMKVRVMQNNIFLDTFSNFGANATPMSFGEVFSALETKAIDAQENPYVTIDTSKFYEVQEYISETKHAYTPFLFLFSKAIFNTYSPEEQQALRDCAAVGRDVERVAIQDLNKASLAKMEEAGLQFNTITPEAQQEMLEKSQVVYDRHKDEIGTDVVDQVQDILAEIRGTN
ncbi:DctP family TRAP transporter solute-binding subunit [Falsirhodobacter halotolerans]|uniref:DctP family TRAP transporter solute-binding subunit n=1 Tax=Falsirhodobacter halotolerans TaxID=1146892 RepID=UPI001FD36467|nr:DctP family TRAP transporter solute-binding subunit [Falsirhodobacter halotolerans]MCJ8140042.1 DctP family TRAP transporter solute-binding subunit [Falsirhodobacter halotolerans]